MCLGDAEGIRPITTHDAIRQEHVVDEQLESAVLFTSKFENPQSLELHRNFDRRKIVIVEQQLIL